MAAIDRRGANINWNVADEAGALYPQLRDGVAVAVLMDIREQLKTLNAVLACPNFLGIPHVLQQIQKQTRRRRPKRKGRR